MVNVLRDRHNRGSTPAPEIIFYCFQSYSNNNNGNGFGRSFIIAYKYSNANNFSAIIYTHIHLLIRMCEMADTQQNLIESKKIDQNTQDIDFIHPKTA